MFSIRNESLQNYFNSNEPTVQISENNERDEELMTVEVIGDTPKMVGYEEESIIQV